VAFESKHIHAPALYGNQWLNGAPVSLHDLDGEVALIDFWDYTRIDCLQAMPYLQEWYRKYRATGLVMVGVHTPEFHFAANTTHVQRAIDRLQIPYPVMLDNDALAWMAYEVRQLPARFLIDKDGFIRFAQLGDGSYWEFERALQQLLAETGYRNELPELMLPIREEDRAGAVCYRPTGEMKLGYLRGALGNTEGYSPESTVEYTDPKIYFPERLYAVGKWMNERECLRFDGEGDEHGSIITLYEANEVNVVMGSRNGSVCEVKLKQDQELLDLSCFGDDVHTLTGNAIVSVDVPRMYKLVNNKQFSRHLLKLTTSNPNLEIYAFSFTTCAIPELIPIN
jgi:thiol-disulfide isomerase/thioredoxin